MGAIVEAISSLEFLTGLRWGGITAAVALLVGIAWRRWRQEPAPLAGLVAVIAGAIAMSNTRPPAPSLLAGLGLLALAGIIFPLTRRFPFLPVLMALPGAWLIRSHFPGSQWLLLLVVGVIAFGGPVISWFDENANGSPLPTLLFALSAAGVWVTVPDTEGALVLLGAMVAPTLLAWPLGLARLGPTGAYALVGLFTWVIAGGGLGRPGSIVGAVAALGMLVAAPIAAWIARKGAVTTTGWAGSSLLVLHALVVGVVTRIAGLKTGARDAAVIAAPVMVTAMLLWLLIERRIARATPKLTRSD